ncbi:hypothetical protein PENTCL1PPCAC_26844, partial [Pristionchus entomophagus]
QKSSSINRFKMAVRKQIPTEWEEGLYEVYGFKQIRVTNGILEIKINWGKQWGDDQFSYETPDKIEMSQMLLNYLRAQMMKRPEKFTESVKDSS